MKASHVTAYLGLGVYHTTKYLIGAGKGSTGVLQEMAGGWKVGLVGLTPPKAKAKKKVAKAASKDAIAAYLAAGWEQK